MNDREIDELLSDGIDADEPHAMEIKNLADRMIRGLLASGEGLPRALTREELEVAAINSIRLARSEWKEG